MDEEKNISRTRNRQPIMSKQDDTNSTTISNETNPQLSSSPSSPRLTHPPTKNNADTKQQRRRPTADVNRLEFAGRIGANQEFSVSADDPDAGIILTRNPDAAAIPFTVENVPKLLHLRGFLQPELYRQAFLEAWGSGLLVYMDGLIAIQLTSTTVASTSPLAIALSAALSSGLTITLFIYAAAPASGGLLNPTITMATFSLGLATFSRTLLYTIAQSAGAIVGAFMLRLSLGREGYFPGGVIPGCTINTAQTSIGQLFVLEWMQIMILVFIAVGVGLDPRQGAVFGPALSPALIGLSLSLVLFASSLAKPGYSGASLNPARCLGLMSADYNLAAHYIHWLASISGVLCNGILYYLIPPYKRESGEVKISY